MKRCDQAPGWRVDDLQEGRTGALDDHCGDDRTMTRVRPLSASTAAATPMDRVRPIRVALVEDCADVRFLLTTVMELDGRFDVVAEANDMRSALASEATTRPDVLLVDLRLGAESGTTVIRRLRRRGTTACIVVVTASDASTDRAAAFDAGADAVLDKVAMTSTMVDDLAALVRRHRCALAGSVSRCDEPCSDADINVCTTDDSDPVVDLANDRWWRKSARSTATPGVGRPPPLSPDERH